MAFRMSILAGIKLIRAAIQSPNYVTGVSGWTINQDGSAEFNNVVIRGGTVISGTALYYNGTPALGNLILSISAAGGTDAFGNVYVGGLAVYASDGSRVQLQSGAGATQYFTPQTVGATVWNPGLVTTTLGALSRGGLQVVSPATSVNTRTSSFSMFGGGPTTNDSSMLFAADTFSFNGDATFTGAVSAPKAWQSGTAQTPAPGGVPAQTSVAVVFPTAFAATPNVQLTPNSTAANLNTTNLRWAVTGKSVNGFTINCWRDTNNATNFEWSASL